jgi:endogenous inhibitor of DNA gyrase (YacG/DUF329 family)
MDADQKQQIQQMRQEGLSYSQIASALGISENTIKSFCRRNSLCTMKSPKPLVAKETHAFCKHCEKPLTHGTKGQPKKFCSEECRRAWWKANDNQLMKKAYYTFKCIGCGKKNESYGNRNRKFCGHACYIKNRFEKGGDEHDPCTV